MKKMEKRQLDIPIGKLRGELKDLRDRVNRILDYIDEAGGANEIISRGTKATNHNNGSVPERDQQRSLGASAVLSANGSSTEVSGVKVDAKQAVVSDHVRVSASPVPTKEFDPLSTPAVTPVQSAPAESISSGPPMVNGSQMSGGSQQQIMPPQQVIQAYQPSRQLQSPLPSVPSPSSSATVVSSVQEAHHPPLPQSSASAIFTSHQPGVRAISPSCSPIFSSTNTN